MDQSGLRNKFVCWRSDKNKKAYNPILLLKTFITITIFESS